MAKIDEDRHEPTEDCGAIFRERGLSRRAFIKSSSVITAAVMMPPLFKPAVTQAADSTIFAYVGCWTSSPSSWTTPPTKERGFGIFKYNPKTGDMALVKDKVMDIISVGETCIDPKRNILYCVDEVMQQPEFKHGGGGRVFALAINPQTGDLKEINRKPSYGSLPAYVAIDQDGKYLITVHHTGNTPVTKIKQDASRKISIYLDYDDACAVLFKLNADGSIGEPCDLYRAFGTGPDVRNEQTHPRIHSIMRSPSGNFFAACDKGADKLYTFRINRKTDKLELCDEYKSFPGSLPRYSAFHPTLPYFYMNHEAKTVISTFRYTEEGRMSFIEAVDAVPPGTKTDRTSMPSDIRVHPSGKYVYLIIRGLDLISVFSVKGQTGQLERIQTEKLEGVGPRGCAISPDGRFIMIALMNANKVVTWAIGEDGKVSPTGKSITQPSPGNVTFFPA